MVAARVCRAVHAATLGKNTNGAEDVGAHGEFLTGALAPASLAGDISLGAFVSRIAADLVEGRIAPAGRHPAVPGLDLADLAPERLSASFA